MGVPPTGQSCATCVFMIEHGADPNFWYECHHDPTNQNPQTNTWRQIKQSDWCGMWSDTLPPGQLAAVSKAGTDPAATASTTEVMMGLGATFVITPVKTGRVAAIVGGTCANDSANGGLNITGRYGTGTAAANGAAATSYQVWSTTQKYFMTSAKDVSGFTVIGGFTGEPLGTPMWFDVSIAATGGGNASVADTQCLLWEL